MGARDVFPIVTVRFVATWVMEFGRLIRTSKFRGAPRAIAYIVAIAEPEKAIALIRNVIAEPEDEVEDLGRVSDALLISLKLEPGEFARADACRGQQ